MKLITRTAAAILIVILMLGMIVYSGSVSEAVIGSIKRCIRIIIPSLFAFMALSKLLISSGLLEKMSTPLDKTLGKLLGMPKGGCALLLISNIAGYPVGASMLADSVKNGRTDKRSAEAALIYCFAGGPAYMINALGVGIYGRKIIGLSLFLSITSANIILAAAVNRIYRPIINCRQKNDICFTKCFTDAVSGAGESIMGVCFIIVFFSAVIAVAEESGVISHICGLFDLNSSQTVMLRSMLEITNSADLEGSALGYLPFLAAIGSFGGVCVLLQIKAVVGDTFRMKLFLMWMPVRMILVFCLNLFYNWIFVGNAVPTFTKSKSPIVELDNFIPSICLIMMIFLLLFQKRLDFLERV